jgi:Flp pilus assembly protein TadD
LGLCLEGAGQREQADGHYRKAVELLDTAVAKTPGDKDLAVRRAITMYLAGEPAVALRELRRLLTDFPDDPLVTAAKYRMEIGSRADFLDSLNTKR